MISNIIFDSRFIFCAVSGGGGMSLLFLDKLILLIV